MGVTRRGTVRDTYAAAINAGKVDVDDADRVIGVVRRPLPWLYGAVDENRPALGAPSDLLDEYHDRVEALTKDGLDDPAAHRRAWDDVDFEARYRAFLDSDPDAAAALDDLQRALDGGEDIVLVCYENTDEKPCHRTILRDRLEG